jgi:hypothetical protein
MGHFPGSNKRVLLGFEIFGKCDRRCISNLRHGGCRLMAVRSVPDDQLEATTCSVCVPTSSNLPIILPSDQSKNGAVDEPSAE